MRVLVVLNENPLGSHPDVYEAFQELVAQGLIEGFDVYPYLVFRGQGKPDSRIAEEILETLRQHGHELVVWMHTGLLSVTDADLDAIEAMPQHPTMVYWEGDSYHPFYKPIPRQMLSIMRRCSQLFMPCGGPIVRSLRRAGVRTVRYAPSCASGTRFPAVWDAERETVHSVVMIGNRVSRRLPLKRMPGARTRERLVKALEKRYGSQFAVYGHGWTGPSAMGPCEFDEQARVYSRASVTIGVNNSTYPLVFSNRLPIAMACGIPVVYSSNARFAEVFPANVRATFFTSVAEALTTIDGLLGSEATALQEMSLRNRAFFETDLMRSLVARHIFESALGDPESHCGEGQDWARGASPDSELSGPRWQRIPPLEA
jgi:hypothetical protein